MKKAVRKSLRRDTISLIENVPVSASMSLKKLKNGPRKKTVTKAIKFIDLFAGIGGFHLALHQEGAECVFVSELDEHARKTYEANFSKIQPELFDDGLFAKGAGRFVGDITKVDEDIIPDFHILTAGFPCQPFSQAGFKKGFVDHRGTLFHDIVRIVKAKKPEAFFLENVSHLLKHDNGITFATIEKTLKGLDYSFHHKIVRASDFGLPQHRARLFMVGFKNPDIEFKFPEPIPLKMTMSDIFGAKCSRKLGYTLRVGGRGSGIKDRRNWDAYMVNGKVVRLGPKEGKKMMGFPDDFVFPVSDVQAMKQLGNAVAVPAIQATAREIIRLLKKHDKRK